MAAWEVAEEQSNALLQLALANASARILNISLMDIDLQSAGGLNRSKSASAPIDFSVYDRAAVDVMRVWGADASQAAVEESVRMGAETLAMAQDVLRQAGDVRALAVLSASQRASLELLNGPGMGDDDSLPGCPGMNMTGILLEAGTGPGSSAGGNEALPRAANERLLAYVTDIYLPHLRTQRAAAVFALLNVSWHA